jgi:hypothetical protein
MHELGSGDRFVALLFFAVLAVSPPLLSIFSAPDLVLGIPVLYLYLFGAWAALIALLARISRRIERGERGPD